LVASVAWPPATVGREAYTAIAWGVGIEPRKDQTSAGGRGFFIRSKATCAAPLCEVPTPLPGVKGHITCKGDRIGTWEISGLAVVIACCVSTAGPRREGEEP